MSIRYLLLWTATTATAMFMLNLFARELGRVAREQFVVGLLLIGLGMVVGWLWMTLALIGWHGTRRTLWPLEPGERLLVSGGGLAAAAATAIAVWRLTTLQPSVGLLLAVTALSVGGIIFFTGGMSFFAGAGATDEEPLAWRILHWTFMLACFLPWCCGALAGVAWLLLPAATGLWLFLAVVADRNSRIHRHWLHWSSVALYGGLAAVLLLLEVIVTGLWLFS